MSNIGRDNYLNHLFHSKSTPKNCKRDYNIVLKTSLPDNTEILYWAANPASHNYSYSGSGLPFPNPDIAFSNSNNKGITTVKNGEIAFSIFYPNSFYGGHGTQIIEPLLFYKVNKKDDKNIKIVKLEGSIKHRSLNYSDYAYSCYRKGPYTYYKSENLKPKTQEEILRENASL